MHKGQRCSRPQSEGEPTHHSVGIALPRRRHLNQLRRDNPRSSIIEGMALLRHANEHRPLGRHPDGVDSWHSTEASILPENDFFGRDEGAPLLLILLGVVHSRALERKPCVPGAADVSALFGEVAVAEDEGGEAKGVGGALGPVEEELARSRSRVGRSHRQGNDELVDDEVDGEGEAATAGVRRSQQARRSRERRNLDNLHCWPAKREDAGAGVAEEEDVGAEGEGDDSAVEDGASGDLASLRARGALENLPDGVELGSLRVANEPDEARTNGAANHVDGRGEGEHEGGTGDPVDEVGCRGRASVKRRA